MDISPRLFTVEQASEYAGVGRTRLFDAAKNGHIRFIKAYGSTRVERSELDRYVDWLIADNGKTRAQDKLEPETA